jgi:hypothetical protein
MSRFKKKGGAPAHAAGPSQSFLPEQQRIKQNPSIKSITHEQRNPSYTLKKINLEPKKTFVSPYSKKTFYKSYY